MRFTQTQMREMLSSADAHSRQAALHYFSREFTSDSTIIDDVIASMRLHGTTKAFRYGSDLHTIPQNEASVAFAVAELQSHSDSPDFGEHARCVTGILTGADPRLIRPHIEAIAAIKRLDPFTIEELNQRIAIAELSADSLWARLDAFVADAMANPGEEIRFHEADAIVEELGRAPANFERTLAFLSREWNTDEAAQDWLEISLYVAIAGWLRDARAIDAIVRALDIDEDGINEACVDALARIGGDDVVRAIARVYPDAEDYVRLYLSSLFQAIHSDFALTTGLELLIAEQDDEQATNLAMSLVWQFATEAVEAARPLADAEPNDEVDTRDLCYALVEVCEAMNYDAPELARWQQTAEAVHPRFAKLNLKNFELEQEFDDEERDEPVEPLHAVAEAGRNDPCPCGSGKKFKKCCLNKPTPASYAQF